MELAGEGGVDDAVAVNIRRPAGVAVDVVQRRDEELVRVLLGVAGELGGFAPGGGEEGDGAVRAVVG